MNTTNNTLEQWRFLYTRHKNYHLACTKTGALKEGNASKSSFIITEGNNYYECLQKAKQECKFNDNQLLGARKTN